MNILFEDQYLIVINKPAGIATQTASIGQRDIYSEALRYRKRKKEPTEIYLVHRLDQPVSGVMLLAKTQEAAALLSQGVNSDFSKEYEAIVYGIPKDPKATLTDYLLKDSKINSSSVVSEKTPGSKRATLSYKVKESFPDNTTLLSIHLDSGRHHQIRVQLANAGFPIVGDLKYGSTDSIKYSEGSSISRVMLCAVSNEFTHPYTGERMKFSVENDFKA